jgi:formylglycine-generating enzyme required for sulfatase activity/peptidoglycan hydrolase CwlO-like protein
MSKFLFLAPISIISSIWGKDFKLDSKDLNSVISTTTLAITAELIDRDSIPYSEAKKKYDDINLRFEEDKASFQNKILKLSVNATYIDRNRREINKDLDALKSILERKKQKLSQLDADILGEQNYIKDLSTLRDKNIKFSSNISIQGYLLAVVEDKRSISRDLFIEVATDAIASEGITQLNGILVETISKFDGKLSQLIRETSSGTAIADNSDTTVKLFFSTDRSTSVLIYATKVDLYPFERGEIINKKSGDAFWQSATLLKNSSDVKKVIEEIKKNYPKLYIDQNIETKMVSAISEIDIHNVKSRNALAELDKDNTNFQNKLKAKIKTRGDNLSLLQSQRKLLISEISELEADLRSLSREQKEFEDQYKLLQQDISDVKRNLRFTKAEMYERRHANAVLETKNIIRELLTDIDKSLFKTSKKMETLFNGSKILKDMVDEVAYEKNYIYSRVFPYFVDNTDSTGALVTLEIKFSDKKIPRVEKKKAEVNDDFVKIETGSFKFGSNIGEKDEAPEKTVTVDKSFYIGKYEVTIGEYLAFADSVGDKSRYPEWHPNYIRETNSSYYNNICIDESCPVVGITWADAKAYAKWLSNKHNKKFRLPTELEWEYVAKGELNREYGFLYGKLDDYGWFNDNSGGIAHRIGSKKPNLSGVYDMMGNVWEFCDSNYGGSDNFKVIKGGDWQTTPKFLRASNKTKYPIEKRSISVGFRLVMEDDSSINNNSDNGEVDQNMFGIGK